MLAAPPISPSPSLPLTSGLVAWLDFSNLASLTVSGGQISQALDLSGGNTASQGVSAKQPTLTSAAQNGLSAASFASANSQDLTFSGFAAPSSWTQFMVCKIASSGQSIFGFCSANQCCGGINTGKYFVENLSGYYQTSALNPSGFNVLTTTLTGTTGTTALNNSNQSGSWSAYAGSGPTIYYLNLYFGGTYGNGGIGEILLYNSVLSAGATSAINGYLKDKWGTP